MVSPEGWSVLWLRFFPEKQKTRLPSSALASGLFQSELNYG
jgi:hypothetical protein